MTMQMSIPVDDFMTPRKARTQGATLRLIRLFFRNLWRSGMMPVMPIIIAIGVWFTSTLLRPGIVLWHDVSVSVAMSYAVVGPLCAAAAAWVGGRPRRRKLDDQLASASLPGWQQDLLTLATAAGIGCIGYGGMVLIVLGWATTQATWGAPYGVVLLSGLLMVVLFCLVGSVTGMLWPNHLAALLVLAIIGGSVAFGNAIQNYGPTSNARELTLLNTLLSLRSGFSEWEAPRVAPELFENMLMASGLSALVIVGVLLVRHRRVVPVAVLAGVVLWSGAGIALSVTGARSDLVWQVGPPKQTASFDHACTFAGTIEVCLHPAWTSLEPEIVDTINGFYAPIEGLDGVPAMLVQMDGRVQFRPAPDGATAFHVFDGGAPQFQIAMGLQDDLFPMTEPGLNSLNEGQMVVGGWLMQEAGARPVFALPWGTAPPETIIAQEQELQAAVDRFDALPSEEQHAWLEVNWDALRAGELTLENLP